MFQFMPSHPHNNIATRYTGKFDLTFKIQRRQLRKANPDSHWCNALERYIKAFTLELNELLFAAFQKLRSDRLASELGLDSASEGEYDSEPEFDDDAHISTATIEMYMKGNFTMVSKSSVDDKSKVPVGEPGAPVPTGVRAAHRSLAHSSHESETLDHSFHRASVIPSAMLLQTLPESVDSSWRGGELVCLLKDGVLEGSSAWRNGAEFSKVVSGLRPIILIKRTDGGGDQNMTNGSVQLADIASFIETGADFYVHSRTAANQSFVNYVEGEVRVRARDRVRVRVR